ncbi:MAG: glycosyltransferase [Burkholderiales bacterium]
MADDFEVYVVGQSVSRHKENYPTDIKWLDIDLNRKISLLADFVSLFRLCYFLVNYKPDIVHSIMPKAGLLAALAGFICRVPIRIHTFTGQIWATKNSVSRSVLYAADKLISALNTICLTDSPSQSMFLLEHHISRRGKALAVLGKGSLSGVELSRFNPRRLEKSAKALADSLGIMPKNFVFAFIARKTREKGAIDILHAFAKVALLHPHCLLLFVGPDESKGQIQKLRIESPLLFSNVLTMDKVDDHELFLAISHVLCLPSYREGFGTIVIDAAALGVPAIGSNIVGLVDSIEDKKTGLLFPAGDIEGLTGAMLSLLENPFLVQSMGQAARERVECYFSADYLYTELKGLYTELSEGR